jgi:hypothetical protein
VTTRVQMISLIIMGHVLFIGASDLLRSTSQVSASDQGSSVGWYEYGPTHVSTIGVIDEAVRFGPPKYGDNPESDQKLTYYYLTLDRPIGVRGNPNSDLNRETFANVRRIQLVVLPSEGKKHTNLRSYLTKKVEVQGKLFQAEAGRHFTDVLMQVEQVTIAK